MKDLGFLSSVEGVVVEAPMEITGIVTGRAALAQRVMTMLLRSEDDPARTFQTGLLQDIGKSNIRDAADLENVFTLATSAVREVIESEQSTRTDLTDDDTLSDIIAENIVVDGTTVSADINIVTVSGESIRVSLQI